MIRFAFGGVVTALAGMIAKHFGPAVGGLFLAFPAIFPASATLLADSEEEKKERVGSDGSLRGRTAAGIDAIGSSMGSIGLVGFAVVIWQRVPKSSLGAALASATLVWFVVSILIWQLREIIRRRGRERSSAGRWTQKEK